MVFDHGIADRPCVEIDPVYVETRFGSGETAATQLACIMTGLLDFQGRAFLANYSLMSQGTSQQIPASPQPAASNDATAATSLAQEATKDRPHLPKEIGGREGPEPTRYGDWEKAGRCIDF